MCYVLADDDDDEDDAMLMRCEHLMPDAVWRISADLRSIDYAQT